MSTLQTESVTAEREVAERIAHRMSMIGWVEDNDIFKALSEDHLPAVELLVDGQRYLVSVERIHQVPVASFVQRAMADGAVQGVLF